MCVKSLPAVGLHLPVVESNIKKKDRGRNKSEGKYFSILEQIVREFVCVMHSLLYTAKRRKRARERGRHSILVSTIRETGVARGTHRERHVVRARVKRILPGRRPPRPPPPRHTPGTLSTFSVLHIYTCIHIYIYMCINANTRVVAHCILRRLYLSSSITPLVGFTRSCFCNTGEKRNFARVFNLNERLQARATSCSTLYPVNPSAKEEQCARAHA